MSNLTVGKLAKASGIGIETVRYYERLGLLPEPERLASGYRIYTKENIQRIRFIKRAQELGFTLEEIKELFQLSQMPQTDCGHIKEKALSKITEVEERITDLMAIKEGLTQLAKFCPGKGKPLNECSILEHFYGDKT